LIEGTEERKAFYHDMDAMAKYATHVLHLSHKQLFFGTKEDFLNSKESIILTGGEVNADV
jgi:zinc transport system ATP-binding protein